MKTPPIPDQIREASLEGYENVYSILPDEKKLFGTETLYGDWGGKVLLLAKHFACSKWVKDRRDRSVAGDRIEPYEHDESWPANKGLVEYVGDLCGSDPTTCGMLYGSVLACMLRDDGRNSGALPAWPVEQVFGQDVFSFVRRSMPNLSLVVCMGREAWQCAKGEMAPNSLGAWRYHREAGTAVEVGGLRLVAAYSTVAWRRSPHVSRAKQDENWRLVQREVERAMAA